MAWKSKFNVAKQWTKQKLGQAEESKEDEVFLGKLKEFSDIKRDFEKLEKASAGFYKANKDVIDAGRALAEALKTLSNNELGGDCAPEFSDMYALVHNAQNNLEPANDAVNTTLCNPVAKLLIDQIENGNKLEKRYNNAKLKYDACQSTLESLQSSKKPNKQKLEEAESNFSASKEKIATIKQEFTEVMESIEKIRDSQIYDSIKLYRPAQAEYFRLSLSPSSAVDSVSELPSPKQSEQKDQEIQEEEEEKQEVALEVPTDSTERRPPVHSHKRVPSIIPSYMQLPPNWEMYETDDGPYYFNTTTQEVSWAPPPSDE